jgi:hypothetical protein
VGQFEKRPLWLVLDLIPYPFIPTKEDVIWNSPPPMTLG